MKELSTYLTNIRMSSIRKLVPYANEAKSKGINVFHLNIGQPDIKTPLSYFQAINEYKPDVIEYMDSQGLFELRTVIKDYYKNFDCDYTENDIFITTGGTEGFLFTLQSLSNPGDEVLILEPYYSNYNIAFNMAEINPNPVLTKASNGFHFTYEDLEHRITDKTKMILLTNPGNPTGTVLTENEIEAVVNIAIEYDLYIIVDEVYREIVFDGKKPFSFGSIKKVEDRLIIIDSISKRFSACGARIGMAITKNEMIKSLFMKLAQGRLAVSSMEQIGALGLYKNSLDQIEIIKNKFEERRNVVFDLLKDEESIKSIKSEGAFYLILGLPVKNAEDFLIWLLKDFSDNNETVMAAPANGFYATKGKGKNEIRIAYVLEEDKLKRAIQILLKGVKEYVKLK